MGLRGGGGAYPPQSLLYTRNNSKRARLHHRLCAGTWQPGQSTFVHLTQHFLKNPQPSRVHRNFLQCLTYFVHCSHSCFPSSPHGVLRLGLRPPLLTQLRPSAAFGAASDVSAATPVAAMRRSTRISTATVLSPLNCNIYQVYNSRFEKCFDALRHVCFGRKAPGRQREARGAGHRVAPFHYFFQFFLYFEKKRGESVPVA